ncbi:UDP-N-acetylmuramoylalanyl-D-glutamyl-2,6-diaminopimelate--D-alanyl-D-alanine ligase [Labilithrix luteola]|uniref:UDP-N-acetylmuramoyl-tripeptide--D-alanyl-D-alanine ligase n=1 Tax=Labilithrix luteola TaxID=1391654 RepID=A0A0K1PWY4_9BACT|nr:UDP-N-acetylmuramoyl-tripeptide--D-alanyl-D-alanine ligase [Labilithrix luteola]AKU98027.1 UDP-N-acetylmuramoylalanyl-D-glutamyl-2,6-diaminopimelate--D-alanyl-D-alanine ligase [Labilithrix luteola]
MATPIPANTARFSIDDVVRATKGVLAKSGSKREVVSVTTDSRAVVPGGAFVALRGASHDGHAFAAGAVERGAALLVVERGGIDVQDARFSCAVVEVDDTLAAWGDLARARVEGWRTADARRRIVAITGSAGKTTTKELTAALLGVVDKTHFTAGNLNNRIGMPAVVLALPDDCRFLVLEMGMSVPGEIDAMATIARPDVAVVTNVLVAHAEGVGGREGVMREKGGVYRALGEQGVAVINGDDDFVIRAAEGAHAKQKEIFGLAEHATYRLVRREPLGADGSRVHLACKGRELVVHLPLPGEAAAIDLAAALAAIEAASGELLSSERIDAALANLQLVGRASVKHLAGDTVVLDDTYNANPGSMRAALATLVEIAGTRRRIAVLGEMKELGPLAEAEHAALGDVIADAGVHLAIGCGGLISLALERAAARGVEVVSASSTAEAARESMSRVLPGDAVLVKGSRSVGAEKVVAVLSEVLPFSPKSASSSEGEAPGGLHRGPSR